MDKDVIIEQYVKMFGELPPTDMIFSYYDENYQELMKDAIEKNKKITPETLDLFLDNKPYDVVESKKFSKFKKGTH